MANKDYSLPPHRDLPAGRLEQRKEHLLAEIARTQPALTGGLGWKGWHASRWVARPRVIAAATTLALMLAGIGLLATRAGTGTASAADLRAQLAQALRTAQTIRGEFTVRTQPSKPLRRTHGCLNCEPPTPVPSRFVIGADGSYAEHRQASGPNPKADTAYNAATGVETSFQKYGVNLYVTAIHLDPAWPGYSPEAELAAWVEHALAARNPHVQKTVFEGRSAWKLTLRFIPGDDFFTTYGARIDVVLDRATGLVLQVTRYADSADRWTSIETIHNLKVGGPTSASDFEIAKPAGARAITHDFGFRRVRVSQAASIVGYRPLLPTHTGGRRLVDFAVAKINSWRLYPGVTGPVYRDAVSARYGRGLNSFVVSTRRGQASEAIPGLTGHSVQLTGLLAGGGAFLSTSPTNPGYLRAFDKGLIVQIFAASGRDAVASANSLTPAR